MTNGAERKTGNRLVNEVPLLAVFHARIRLLKYVVFFARKTRISILRAHRARAMARQASVVIGSVVASLACEAFVSQRITTHAIFFRAVLIFKH